PDGDGRGDGAQGRARDALQPGGQFAGPYLEGPGRHVGGQVQEAPVAEVQQVPGDLPDAVGDVQVHRGRAHPGRRVAVQHHQGQLVAPDRAQGVGGHRGGDDAVQGGLCGREGVAGRADALRGGVEHHTEAVPAGDARGARVDPGEELRGERGNHQQDRAGAAQAQVAGGEVGPVAEAVRGLADALRGGLGDPAAPLVAQDQGDRGLGDTGGPGDVPARGSGAGPCHRRPAPSSGLANSRHGTYGTAVIRTTHGPAPERPVSGGLGMATGYLEILRVRHAARLLVGTLVGRLPNATAAIAIVLFVRAEGGSYSLAGALAAVYGVANAVGQPVLGRLVDLRGQPRVQLPAAVLSALAMAVFAFAGIGPLPLAYAAVAAAGLFTPP